MRGTGFLLAVLILASSSISTAAGQQDTSAAEAVRQAADSWAQAARERDADRVVSFFDENVIAMYPHPQPTQGREANRLAWVEVFREPGATHPITIDTLVVAASGDLAYTLGRWGFADGSVPHRVQAGGRYVAVWKRTGDSWRIVALSANEHKPPPPLNP